MSKEQQAVIKGLVITVLIVGFLTLLWATYIHLLPDTWNWLKTAISFLNYSFALYLGMLSASLSVKSSKVNAPLYVMLIFFFLNIFLRIYFISIGINYWLVIVKFFYSIILLAIAFYHARFLQNKQKTYSYGGLR